MLFVAYLKELLERIIKNIRLFYIFYILDDGKIFINYYIFIQKNIYGIIFVLFLYALKI